MKYLCLVFNDEKMRDTMSKSEFDALVAEHLATRRCCGRAATSLLRRPSSRFGCLEGAIEGI
jgi:hypothetical protein